MDNLETLVVAIEDAGLAWVESKLQSDQIDEGMKPFLDSLKNDLEKGFVKESAEYTEAKLERLARGSAEYRQYVDRKCIAVADTLRKKVRYDNLLNLLEARRSKLAMERVKIEKGIFHEGR